MNGQIVHEAMKPVLFMLACVGVIVLAHHACGCSPKPADKPELPSYCFDEDLLRAKVFACVASAETKAESQLCRKQSLKACGIETTP